MPLKALKLDFSPISTLFETQKNKDGHQLDKIVIQTGTVKKTRAIRVGASTEHSLVEY
jgi:hypothetical protein